MDGDATPQLYTVLPEKNVGVGQSSLLSTNRVYDFQSLRKETSAGGVDIALNPDEPELTQQALEARYQKEMSSKETNKEDLRDMVSEHLNKTNKVKRRNFPHVRSMIFSFILETQRKRRQRQGRRSSSSEKIQRIQILIVSTNTKTYFFFDV